MSYLPLPPSASASSSRPVTYNPNPSQAISSGARDGTNPSTPLRSVKASNGFEYPPIWSFPPFFTLQPNPTTLSHQLGLWTTLVLNWARFSRVWEVNTDSPQPGDVFMNKTIGRKLLPPSLKQLLAHMVKEGQAVAEPPKQTSRYLLYWRKPEEWGTLIYDWITENGLGGSIMTFYEITDGDLSFSTEFREMPPSLLRKSLDTLVKRGKAQIIKGEGEAGEGVRFL